MAGPMADRIVRARGATGAAIRRVLLAGVSAGVLLFASAPAAAGPAIGLIGPLAGAALSAAGVSAIATALITTAISFVAGQLFGPDQPKPPKPEDRGRLIASIQADAPHKYIVGRARVAGDVARRHRKSKPDSNKNEYFYQVQVVAAHECDAFEEWWVDNKLVEIDEDGWVLTAPYGEYEVHEAKLEFASQPADGETIALDGQTYTYRSATPGDQEILIGADVQETAENTYDALTAGDQPGRIDDLEITYVAAVTGTEETPENAGIVVKWDGAADLDSSFPLAEASAGLSWSRADLRGAFNGKLRVFWGLGSRDQVANAWLRSELPDVYPATARGRGRAYIGFRAEYDEKTFPNGEPKVSVVVRGLKLPDPRTGTTVWSDNPALALAWFKRADIGYGARADEIDETLLVAAANVCDETVAIPDFGNGAGTEKRYRCNGVIDTSQDRAATRAALLGAMGGRTTFAGGQWRIFAGAYEAPAVEIDETWWTGSDINGSQIKWTPRRSRRDLINTVRGTFISPEHKWQPIAYPPRQDRDALAADNGMTRAEIDALADNAAGGGAGSGDDLDEVPGLAPLVKVLDQPFITSPTQAQRVAWIALRGNRQQGVFEGETDWLGLRVRACSVVSLTHARAKLIGRDMVCTTWRLGMRDDGHPVIRLTLQQDAAAVYATASGDLKGLPEMEAADLPASNLNDPAAPSGGSVAA